MIIKNITDRLKAREYIYASQLNFVQSGVYPLQSTTNRGRKASEGYYLSMEFEKVRCSVKSTNYELLLWLQEKLVEAIFNSANSNIMDIEDLKEEYEAGIAEVATMRNL